MAENPASCSRDRLSPTPQFASPLPSMSQTNVITIQHGICSPAGQMTAHSVKAAIEELETRFNGLKNNTRERLVKQRRSVEDVVDALIDIPEDTFEEYKQFLEKNMRRLYKQANLKILFAKMKLVCSLNYLSYYLLEYLIKVFKLVAEGREMEAYKSDVQRFKVSTPLKIFCETQTKRRLIPPKEFEEVVGEFKWPDNVTLEVVERFRKEFACHYHLRECAMMLSQVLIGSFIVIWYIPECIAGKLKENVPIEILKKYNTAKLEIAGDCVYEVSRYIYP